jgi:hypothetical protein
MKKEQMKHTNMKAEQKKPAQTFELSDQALEQVAGGLNPQPLPPRQFPTSNPIYVPYPDGEPWQR